MNFSYFLGWGEICPILSSSSQLVLGLWRDSKPNHSLPSLLQPVGEVVRELIPLGGGPWKRLPTSLVRGGISKKFLFLSPCCLLPPLFLNQGRGLYVKDLVRKNFVLYLVAVMDWGFFPFMEIKFSFENWSMVHPLLPPPFFEIKGNLRDDNSSEERPKLLDFSWRSNSLNYKILYRKFFIEQIYVYIFLKKLIKVYRVLSIK